MRNMDKISLNANDICKIIKQCDVSGVSEFQYEGMSFKFLPRRNEEAVQLGQATDPELFEAAVAEKTPELGSAQFMNEDLMEEAEEAQLLIDDPQAYEKLQIDRHIEHGRQMNEKN
jgi:hypothetical protein